MQKLNFDNTFVRELPGDKETSNSLRQVGCTHSRVRNIITFCMMPAGSARG